jgi:hypothetical protein
MTTHVLDKICRVQGVLSDDNSSIVDKYSGFVIRNLDFVEEDTFDENGFKLVSNEVIKNLSAIVNETLNATKNAKPIISKTSCRTTYTRCIAQYAKI